MYSSSKYEIEHLSGNGGLCYYDDGEDSIEQVRQFIDETNARAVSRGYKEEQFCIVRTEFHSFFDKNGYFLRREITTNRVEIYPAILTNTKGE